MGDKLPARGKIIERMRYLKIFKRLHRTLVLCNRLCYTASMDMKQAASLLDLTYRQANYLVGKDIVSPERQGPGKPLSFNFRHLVELQTAESYGTTVSILIQSVWRLKHLTQDG